MNKVELGPLQHRGKTCIGIWFEISDRIQAALRRTGVVKFSNTHKCWYTPLNRANYNKVFFALQGLAHLEYSALADFLAAKKKRSTSPLPVLVPAAQQPVTPVIPPPARQAPPQPESSGISAENAHILPAMLQHLQLKAYSPSTIRTYLSEMAQLLKTLKSLPADRLTTDHLKRYLVYCYDKLGLKENTLHSRMNAIYPVGFKSWNHVLLCLCTTK